MQTGRKKQFRACNEIENVQIENNSHLIKL